MAKKFTRKQLAAIKSIVSNGKRGRKGLNSTTHITCYSGGSGKLAAVDNYHCVIFDECSDYDIDIIQSDPDYNWREGGIIPNCDNLFKQWYQYLDTGFGLYSEKHKDIATIDDISNWCRDTAHTDGSGNKVVVREFGAVRYAVNAKMLKDVCIAVGGRKNVDGTLLIYYANEGIIVDGERGYGIVMPIRL